EAGGVDPPLPPPRVAPPALLLRPGGGTAAAAGLHPPSDAGQGPGGAQPPLGPPLARQEGRKGGKTAPDAATAALPGVAEAQAALGTAAYNVGELKLAADAYGRAVALEPENVAYLANYGLFLGYDGRLDEGLQVLQKVVARPDGQSDAGAF